MMKILILTSSYPSSYDIINHTFMSELADALSVKSIQIYVLSPHIDGLLFRETHGNVTIIRFPYWFTAKGQKLGETGGLIPSLSQSRLAVFQLIPFCICQFFFALKITREENIDLVHSHWIIPQGLTGALIRFFFSIPHVTSIHGTDIHLVHAHRLTYPFIRWIARYTDYITTNSTHTCRKLREILPVSGKKIRVIPMGIHVNTYNRQVYQNKPGEKVILFVGRLIPWKGVRFLIKAVKVICNELIQVRVIIIGDGPEKENLENLSRTLELEQIIAFPGRQDRDALLNCYRQADLFVLPSIIVDGQTEGLGVVLLEAMAAGVPVIGSNTGGIPDIIEDGVNGLLVPPGDPQALACAMIRILTDPDLAERFRKAGLETVKNRFSWDVISEQFAEVYRQALLL